MRQGHVIIAMVAIFTIIYLCVKYNVKGSVIAVTSDAKVTPSSGRETTVGVSTVGEVDYAVDPGAKTGTVMYQSEYH